MSLPAFPPPLQPAAHLRLAYTREESLSPSRLPPTLSAPDSRPFSHSRGRPRALSGAGVSRDRSISTTRTSDWGGSEWDGERGRSVSSNRSSAAAGRGRDGSRAPLWRIGQGRGVERSASRVGEVRGGKEGGGGGGEKTEDEVGGGKEGWGGWMGRLGRHFVGVRGDKAFPTPLLPFLRPLPLHLETPLLTFLGTFPSILLCAGISTALSRIDGTAWDETPLTFGSLGATAVLLYALPEAPLSQPRNVVGGHMICALVGCVISQLFSLSPRFTSPLQAGIDNEIASVASWTSLTPVAAALAVGLAVLGMQLTGTLHPPGGATALIAAYHLRPGPRWTYLLLVFLSITAMEVWAMVVNNLGRRRYPAYWWTPPSPDSAALSPPSPPLSESGKPPTQHFNHSPAHPHSLSPERDLQQRWLGRLGEVDEEALAGGEYEEGEENVGGEEVGEEGREMERSSWEEEEERGRRATRRGE
ncbi:hypothetical protein JCM6882_008834 [Rhodosporidiobolus microsporus]